MFSMNPSEQIIRRDGSDEWKLGTYSSLHFVQRSILIVPYTEYLTPILAQSLKGFLSSMRYLSVCTAYRECLEFPEHTRNSFGAVFLWCNWLSIFARAEPVSVRKGKYTGRLILAIQYKEVQAREFTDFSLRLSPGGKR